MTVAAWTPDTALELARQLGPCPFTTFAGRAVTAGDMTVELFDTLADAHDLARAEREIHGLAEAQT